MPQRSLKLRIKEPILSFAVTRTPLSGLLIADRETRPDPLAGNTNADSLLGCIG